MRAVSLLVVAPLLLLAFACSDPRVAEDRAAACSNKMDDDGDGLVDCEDPDCAGTEACEKTTETCENGLDDDRNGTLDCRQESCKALPVCRDAELKETCRLLPDVAAMGCPLGKGCYLTSDGNKWCALEGPGLAGATCGNGDPSDRSQGCAAAHLCNERKRCVHLCTSALDCTRNSICNAVGIAKLCTASCLPGRGCDANEECVAFQRDGLTLADGGWAHECRSRPPARGRATLGTPCADEVNLTGPDPITPDSEICEPGLLCVPGPSGARCRRVCGAPADGSPGRDVCEGGTSCYAVVPFSSQSARFDESYAVGVCLP
jgi:hypothetical protein